MVCPRLAGSQLSCSHLHLRVNGESGCLGVNGIVQWRLCASLPICLAGKLIRRQMMGQCLQTMTGSVPCTEHLVTARQSLS